MPNARGRSLRLVFEFEFVELMSTLSGVDKFKVCNELWHAHVWAALQELTAFKGRTGISLVPLHLKDPCPVLRQRASSCSWLSAWSWLRGRLRGLRPHGQV